MSRAVTVVISDLHVGGGAADPGDDHVYQNRELVRFLTLLGGMTQAPLELVINGDFLEFAQVAPEVYKLGSARCWCSEEESLQKLEVILTGHADIFEALRRFKSAYRTVTVAPGNHDVDLYWPRVQRRLEEVAGVRIAAGKMQLKRHGGRLWIEHGHMEDPANRFSNWTDPFTTGPGGEKRLEMCPGTLFMVKFINDLERDYPFADNVKPISAFARLLLREGRPRWLPVAWALLRFGVRHPISTLGRAPRVRGDQLPDLPRMFDDAFGVNAVFRARVVALNTRVGGEPGEAAVRARFASSDALADFIALLVVRLPPNEWLPVFEEVVPQTLGLVRSAGRHEKELLATRARELLATEADVVVFGHTHQPDQWEGQGKAYFNPGSWTRYVEVDRLERGLTMNELRDESLFPYALNYVWIEETDNGSLVASMRRFEP